MKIILLGYMASGKSVIAKELAKKMNLKSIDLDHYIEEKEKIKINEIFKKHGEIKFRMLENNYLKEILEAETDLIIAVGGGTPCYANNMDLIVNGEVSIYLNASIETLFQRLIKDKSNRPLVSEIPTEKLKEFIAKHLFERNVFYNRALSKIKVDHKSIDEIVEEIIKLHSLKSNNLDCKKN